MRTLNSKWSHDDSDARSTEQHGARSQIRVVSPPSAHPRLLLVDDDIVILNVLGRLLDDYDVLGLTSAHEALARIKLGERFDLVLSDVTMHELRGDELYAAVAREAPAMARRFVFMTGGVVSRHVSDLLAATNRPILRKPFTRAELDAFVRQALRDGAAADAG